MLIEKHFNDFPYYYNTKATFPEQIHALNFKLPWLKASNTKFPSEHSRI